MIVIFQAAVTTKQMTIFECVNTPPRSLTKKRIPGTPATPRNRAVALRTPAAPATPPQLPRPVPVTHLTPQNRVSKHCIT